MVIQERDRVIKELEEKVAFLEAEVNAAYYHLLHFFNHEKKIHESNLE